MRLVKVTLIYHFLLAKLTVLCLCLSVCRRSISLGFVGVIPRLYGYTECRGILNRGVSAASDDLGAADVVEKDVNFRSHEDETLLRLRRQVREKYGREVPLREYFIKGTGPGGQKVNKTNNCVQLIQYSSTLGTNIVVKCHIHRSLLQNRIEATRILLRKLEEAETEPIRAAKHLQEKEKRKILKLTAAEKAQKKFEKQLRSEKKANRRKTKIEDDF